MAQLHFISHNYKNHKNNLNVMKLNRKEKIESSSISIKKINMAIFIVYIGAKYHDIL